eukprot:scaffold3045_cov179-Ochromonas_danica.AAC.3
MLTTRAAVSSATASNVVSLHHAKTGGSLAIQAVCGAFRPQTSEAFFVLLDESGGYDIVGCDLHDLLSNHAQLPGAAPPYRQPLSPSQIQAKTRIAVRDIAIPSSTTSYQLWIIADRVFLLTSSARIYMASLKAQACLGSVVISDVEEVLQGALDSTSAPSDPSLVLLVASRDGSSSSLKVSLRQISECIMANSQH